MGNMCQHSDVKFYENIYGVRLKLYTSSSTRCGGVIEEIHIESPPFQFQKWFTYTALFMAILLHIGIHHQHTTILTIICTIFIIIFLAKLHQKVTKESLLIIKNVGIEITTMFASGRKSYKFIAWERISGTVINEAVTMVKAFIETILQVSH